MTFKTITSVLTNLGIWRNRAPIGDPFLIYQMGKVGSSTILTSLQKTGIKNPIFHLHLLNNLDEIEAFVLKTRPNPQETLNEIEKCRRLREEFLSGKFGTLNIITLVRDPVARNVSAFFQNIYEVIPDFDENKAIDEKEVAHLKQKFLNDYDHNAPLDWFDTQLRDVFGFDVYSHEFPKEKGYAIFHHERVKILILRLEDLNRNIKTAMHECFGLKNFEVQNTNIGQDKSIGKIYKAFVSELSLPDVYLNRMYFSKFAVHFYTTEELSNFRQKWANK